MKRVMVVGGAGSGKSWLADVIGQDVGLPVAHIDPLYWAAGWVQRPADETLRLVRAAVLGDAWVFDGNHSASWDERAALADTLIFLDMPRWLRMVRVFRRTVRGYGRDRPDLPDCPQRFSWEFTKFVWNYGRRGRPKTLRLLDDTRGNITQIVLRTRRDVRRFVAELPKTSR